MSTTDVQTHSGLPEEAENHYLQSLMPSLKQWSKTVCTATSTYTTTTEVYETSSLTPGMPSSLQQNTANTRITPTTGRRLYTEQKLRNSSQKLSTRQSERHGSQWRVPQDQRFQSHSWQITYQDAPPLNIELFHQKSSDEEHTIGHSRTNKSLWQEDWTLQKKPTSKQTVHPQEL